MNTISRILIGLFSSLLLTAGLARAAERMDPLSHQLSKDGTVLGPVAAPVSPCSASCYFVPRPVVVPVSQLN